MVKIDTQTTLILLVGSVLVAAIVIATRRADIPEDEIIQRWGQLLPGQADLEKEWLERIQTELKNRKFPYELYTARVHDDTAVGERQEFLACDLDGGHVCYIGSAAIGEDLHVNWAVRAKPSFSLPIIGPILKAIFKKSEFAITNWLRAALSVTMSATIAAAEDIMEEKLLDKSMLNRKSSGKLGPI